MSLENKPDMSQYRNIELEVGQYLYISKDITEGYWQFYEEKIGWAWYDSWVKVLRKEPQHIINLDSHFVYFDSSPYSNTSNLYALTRNNVQAAINCGMLFIAKESFNRFKSICEDLP